MFSLTAKQLEKIRAWEHDQDRIVIEQQKGTDLEHLGEAYYGAIGGAVTYCFTPTSLGVAVTVKHAVTGAELNVTDYDAW